MSITIEQLDIESDICNQDAIMVMPINYSIDNLNKYSSTTISFWKYARNKIEIELFSEPKMLVEQRSGEWFGPTILLSSSILTGNNELISVLCGVISNYLTDFFKGNAKEPKIKLKVLYTETDTTKTTEISYEGDIEGIDKLEQSIKEVVKKGR